MKVVKSYNNNIILAETNNRQIVAVGAGIGFAKKAGDNVDVLKVESTFNFSDNELKKLNLEILKDFDIDEMTTIRDIINQIETKYERKFNSSMILSLIDHIKNSLEHPPETDEHPLRWIIKRTNPHEYEMAKYFILELAQSDLEIVLPHFEITSIALHFINNQDLTSMKQTVKVSEDINSIISIIEFKTGSKLDKMDIDYSRFIVHLRFLLNRLDGNPQIEEKNLDTIYYSIYESTSKFNQEILQSIIEFLEQKYTGEIGKAEKVYLLIYLNKLIQS